MPNVKDLKRRIRSVENTGKVTNAMSLVAASKMRRAQQAVTQARPFAEKILEVIAHLAAQPADDSGQVQALLQIRPVQRVGIVIVSPDRGLCGGLHANLNRRVEGFIRDQDAPVRLIAVGRKGTLVTMVTATFVGLYVLQPQIIAASPRMKPALTEYVDTVDRYRFELNEKTTEWKAWLVERVGALGDDDEG